MGTSVLFPIVLILLLFFMLSRGRRRQQQQAATAAASLVVGARVMTTSGLHASVIEIRDTTVVLEIAPGVRTIWSRAAVSRAIDEDVIAPGPDPVSDGVPPAAPGASSVSFTKTERPEL